jgi:hypothetical protein
VWADIHGGLKVYVRDGESKDQAKLREYRRWQRREIGGRSG